MKNLEKWQLEIGSNADQDYSTHSLFRYFGKLPPVLTRNILEEYVPKKNPREIFVFDFMCGSGTTLVEAQDLGFNSIGVDSNNLSVLISKTKTTYVSPKEIEKAIERFRTDFQVYLNSEGKDFTQVKIKSAERAELRKGIPPLFNLEKWFNEDVQFQLAICKKWIDSYKSSEKTHSLLLVCWAGIIRQSSNASARTGRIFFDKDKKKQNVFLLYKKRLEIALEIFRNVDKTKMEINRPNIYCGDARYFSNPLHITADISFFHPPYFALYKYSSDVLRFELEWMGLSRKEIQKREIEDGFKTTNPLLVNNYVDDLVLCAKNALKNTSPKGKLLIVVGNSTLSEKPLPIIETFIAKSKQDGLKCAKIIERKIEFSQSAYHRSANPRIKSDTDYILVFQH